MQMTYHKPTKPGWYIYSKCFIPEAKEAIETAPYGIILVAFSDRIFTFDTEPELVSISPWSESIMPVSELTGMFSEKPIDILEMIGEDMMPNT